MSNRESGKPWSAKELADATGLDPSHIRRLLIEGKLRGYKIGNAWAISEEETRRFLEERKSLDNE